MYEITEKLFFVRKVNLFANLELRLLTQIAAIAEETTFQQDEWIFRQGDVGDALYLLIDGEVSITLQGDEVNVMTSPHSFGEIALVDNGTRTAGARAKTDVHALRIGKQAFEELMEVSPEIRLGVLRELSNRLRALNEGEAAAKAIRYD